MKYNASADGNLPVHHPWHKRSRARSVGKAIGHFFGVMQIDDWIHVFRNTKPAPGTDAPIIPGEPEREAEAIRSKEGIPLLKSVVDDLLDISRKTGIPFEAR
jgi:L-2-hydroxycarboxylate dehydrogenase (NAD+)